jgi:hypothetical protein
MRSKLHLSALSALLALPLASLAACNWNEVEQGRLGVVELTPSDCGQPGCDLDDGVAVGGSLEITLAGQDGVDVSDLRLISSAPWILEVTEEQWGLEPRFRVLGRGAGLADLIAIDRYGYEVDYLPVEVATISAFEVVAIADGMTMSTVPGLGRLIEVPAGTELELEVDGTSRGRVLTGDVQLLVEIDGAIAAAMMPGSDPARGELRFRAPSGTHDLVFRAPGGASERVRIVGGNALEPTR